MIVIVMGVVGAGKTTIGRMLAQQLGWEFADADDFHPKANIDKIRHGISLTDADREPWLESLRSSITLWIKASQSVVLACSALKHNYREMLRVGPEVRFVYLKGSPKLIAERLSARHGHFANDQILAGQFHDLQEPHDSVTVEISASPEQIVQLIRKQLGLE